MMRALQQTGHEQLGFAVHPLLEQRLRGRVASHGCDGNLVKRQVAVFPALLAQETIAKLVFHRGELLFFDELTYSIADPLVLGRFRRRFAGRWGLCIRMCELEQQN